MGLEDMEDSIHNMSFAHMDNSPAGSLMTLRVDLLLIHPGMATRLESHHVMVCRGRHDARRHVHVFSSLPSAHNPVGTEKALDWIGTIHNSHLFPHFMIILHSAYALVYKRLLYK